MGKNSVGRHSISLLIIWKNWKQECDFLLFYFTVRKFKCNTISLRQLLVGDIVQICYYLYDNVAF